MISLAGLPINWAVWFIIWPENEAYRRLSVGKRSRLCSLWNQAWYHPVCVFAPYSTCSMQTSNTRIMHIFMTQSWQAEAQSTSKYGPGPKQASWRNSRARINLLPAAADPQPNTRFMQRRKEKIENCRMRFFFLCVRGKILICKPLFFITQGNNLSHIRTISPKLFVLIINHH